MAVTMIQDLRWGDTGKGKISEHLSHPDRCGVSVRAVGGGNAGHVIMRDTRKMSLHILPAGCVHDDVDLVLGRGMVTHIPTLMQDAAQAKNIFGTDPLSRLHIAKENHLLLMGHKRADIALEKRKGEGAVGTTGSGIGPAYADKALRVGLRMEELQRPIAVIKDDYAKLLRHWKDTYGVELNDEDQGTDIESLVLGKELLEGHITDLTAYWHRAFYQIALGQKRDVVIEGAQGSLLCTDAEGYPYVTSSATTVNGHLQGAGIPHRELTKVIGTLKLYDTRVGNGPMRTEFPSEEAARLRELGGERGSTTGRNRRVGWLDLEDTGRRAWEEGAVELAVLKGDVLDPYDSLSFAVGSDADGVKYARFPGWQPASMRGVRVFEQLPPQAQDIYRYIQEYTNTPIRYIGTGPESSQLIVKH